MNHLLPLLVSTSCLSLSRESTCTRPALVRRPCRRPSHHRRWPTDSIVPWRTPAVLPESSTTQRTPADCQFVVYRLIVSLCCSCPEGPLGAKRVGSKSPLNLAYLLEHSAAVAPLLTFGSAHPSALSYRSSFFGFALRPERAIGKSRNFFVVVALSTR